MPYHISDKKNIQYLIALLKQQGIRQLVLSPGSRNAPMLISFPQDKYFEIYSIVDERSAGFFALGLALASGRPVVLNCTSGSALLNYAPAIAEAYYQHIPLVVVSADRPEHLIDQGYGQCLRQPQALATIVKAHLHLPQDAFEDEVQRPQSTQQLQALLSTAVEGVPGPVHVNMALSEPLYAMQQVEYPTVPTLPAVMPKSWALPVAFVQQWQASDKKMLLIGQLNKPSLALLQALKTVAQQPHVVVLSEALANTASIGYSNIDALLAAMLSDEQYKPQLVLSVGGHVVSKRIKQWLCGQSFEHWQLSEKQQLRDTFFNGVQRIDMPAAMAVEQLCAVSATEAACEEDAYGSRWQQLAHKVAQAHDSFVARLPFSDFKVYALLRAQLLQQARLHLHFANSAAIRYAQLFSWQTGEGYCPMQGNRGVSGLEGSLSTALGYAQHSEALQCLLTGDLAFFYDANALWNDYLKPNMRVLLFNNHGGGIFRFIEGPMQSGKLPYFETPHQRDAKALATAAGMRYKACYNDSELRAALPDFLSPQPQAYLLEVHTPAQDNDKVLKAYFAAVANG